MKNLGRIYGIFDKNKNKIVYIGKTTNTTDYKPHGKQIKRLFLKYPERYTYTILEEKIDVNLLNIKEQEYIQKYNTFNDKNCFNYTIGGDGGNTIKNKTESEKKEIINKRISSIKKTTSQPEYKEKMKPIWKRIGENTKKHLTGRKLTVEHKENISKGMLKAMEDPEIHNKISHKGQKKPPRTDTHKKNISLATKGKKKSEQHKLKIKQIQQGRKKITNGKKRTWLFAHQIMPDGWWYVNP